MLSRLEEKEKCRGLSSDIIANISYLMAKRLKYNSVDLRDIAFLKSLLKQFKLSTRRYRGLVDNNPIEELESNFENVRQQFGLLKNRQSNFFKV